MRRTACRLGCSQTEWISNGGVDLRRQSRDSRDSEHTLMGLFLGWAAVVDRSGCYALTAVIRAPVAPVIDEPSRTGSESHPHVNANPCRDKGLVLHPADNEDLFVVLEG